jgi:hypothetical protein
VSTKTPAVPCRVNWRPPDARAAYAVHDMGGPLVDPATGDVILLASLSDALWTQFIALPPGASPTPVPIDPLRRSGLSPAARAAWQARGAVA